MVVGDSFCNSGAPFGLEELDLLVEDSLSLQPFLVLFDGLTLVFVEFSFRSLLLSFCVRELLPLGTYGC